MTVAAVLTPDDLARFDDLTDRELLRLRESHAAKRNRARSFAESKRHHAVVSRIDLYRARRKR